MNVQAQASLYPLRTATLTEPIDRFLERLRNGGLSVAIGPMSSRIVGQCDQVFHGLAEAFQDAARGGDVVLTVKVSNACPNG